MADIEGIQLAFAVGVQQGCPVVGKQAEMPASATGHCIRIIVPLRRVVALPDSQIKSLVIDRQQQNIPCITLQFICRVVPLQRNFIERDAIIVILGHQRTVNFGINAKTVVIRVRVRQPAFQGQNYLLGKRTGDLELRQYDIAIRQGIILAPHGIPATGGQSQGAIALVAQHVRRAAIVLMRRPGGAVPIQRFETVLKIFVSHHTDAGAAFLDIILVVEGPGYPPIRTDLLGHGMAAEFGFWGEVWLAAAGARRMQRIVGGGFVIAVGKDVPGLVDTVKHLLLRHPVTVGRQPDRLASDLAGSARTRDAQAHARSSRGGCCISTCPIGYSVII